jgi:hypothetical protein
MVVKMRPEDPDHGYCVLETPCEPFYSGESVAQKLGGAVVTRPGLITDGRALDRRPSPLLQTFFCAQQFGSLVQQELVTVLTS